LFEVKKAYGFLLNAIESFDMLYTTLLYPVGYIKFVKKKMQ